jgi:flavin-binding protein dodecin
MAEHTYKIIELVGASPNGVDAAIDSAILRAAETLDQLKWFEVKEIRGQIEGGEISHYQVTVRIGFAIKAPNDEDAD